METILLDDFLDQGIIKEKSFREQIDCLDLKKYEGKKVIIKGCASSPLIKGAQATLKRSHCRSPLRTAAHRCLGLVLGSS